MANSLASHAHSYGCNRPCYSRRYFCNHPVCRQKRFHNFHIPFFMVLFPFQVIDYQENVLKIISWEEKE
jgi:hypothetical protein